MLTVLSSTNLYSKRLSLNSLFRASSTVKSPMAPPVFSGATIMGDGVPALILDAGGLV